MKTIASIIEFLVKLVTIYSTGKKTQKLKKLKKKQLCSSDKCSALAHFMLG